MKVFIPSALLTLIGNVVANDCIFCIQSIPECMPACHPTREVCHVTAQTCKECSKAFCLPLNGTLFSPPPTPRPATEDESGCIFCPLMIPQCNCEGSDEQCVIIKQTCQSCAKAICLPKLPLRIASANLSNLLEPIPIADLIQKLQLQQKKKKEAKAKGVPLGQAQLLELQMSIPPADLCVVCPRVIPVCPTCPEDSSCYVTEQSCTDCQRAVCLSNKAQKNMLQKYALLEEEKEVVLATDADVLKVKCVKCLWQPSCDTIRCPGESKCVLMKGNCQQCDRVTCVQSQHRQNKERGDKNQRKPENLPENKPQVPCVQCLWNPTCEVVNCPQGTKCHFKAATCHSCAEATCIKDESTPEIA